MSKGLSIPFFYNFTDKIYTKDMLNNWEYSKSSREIIGKVQKL